MARKAMGHKHALLSILVLVAHFALAENSATTDSTADLAKRFEALQLACDSRLAAQDRRFLAQEERLLAQDARFAVLEAQIASLQSHGATSPQFVQSGMVDEEPVFSTARQLQATGSDSASLALVSNNSTLSFGATEDASIFRSGSASLSVRNNLNVLGKLTAAQLDVPAFTTLQATVAALVQANTQLGTQNNPSTSCYALKQALPSSDDGVYWIDPNGGDPVDAFQVFCEMTTDGGGWTFVAHVDALAAATASNSIFTESVGNYKTSRVKDGTTYSLAGSVITQTAHTQMMVTLDTSSPAAAEANNKLVFFQYPAGHSAFSSGPLTCRGLNQGFKYRTTSSGAFTDGSTTNACDASNWSPLTPGGAALSAVTTSTYGVSWGVGMGGDNTFSHDSWYYIRSVTADTTVARSQATAVSDCGALHTSHPNYPSGAYFIDPNGGSHFDAFLAYCDMDTDGGGWTMVAQTSRTVSSAASFFSTNMGRYRPDRAVDEVTYSRGGSLLDYVQHTQMMITLDDPDPVTAMGNMKVVFYQYPLGHPAFTTGPISCTGLTTGFSYRMDLSGPFTPNGTSGGCTASAWYPRMSTNTYILSQYGSTGTYWGNGMGGDNTWSHTSWIYVRNVTQHPAMDPLGMSQATPAASCKALLTAQPSTASGVYWIDPNGGSTADAWLAYCDMVTDGGGWTFIAKTRTNAVPGNIFAADIGTYRADRFEDATVYSKSSNLMSDLQHTQMMFSLDNPDPTVSAPLNKLITYQYTAGNPLFQNTPLTSCANPSFEYKLGLDGAFQPSDKFACVNYWYPQSQWGLPLTYFHSSTGGTYWGTGMGGDNSWTHAAWIYVREQAPSTAIGFDRTNAATDCMALKTAAPSLPDGSYWIDPNGGSDTDAFLAYCDMTTDGGGWTFAAYVAGTVAATNLFSTDIGQYSQARLTTPTLYNKVPNLLGAIPHTEMMLTLDSRDAATAIAAHKMVMYQYSAGATAFNSGPIACSSLTAGAYNYRLKPAGVWHTSRFNPTCSAASWYPASDSGNALYLSSFSSSSTLRGVQWGTGMNGDNTWAHPAWIYVRAKAPVLSGYGLLQSTPAVSCLDLLQACPTCGDGRYWIDPNGGNTNDAFVTFCDMTTDGGGWTFWAHSDAAARPGLIFTSNLGTFSPYQYDSGTWNQYFNLYGELPKTQMMMVFDNRDASASLPLNKVLFFNFDVSDPAFNTGPIPCTSLLTSTTWSYRVTERGVFLPPGTSVCTAAAWRPVNSANAILTQFSSATNGNHWGVGMGGDNLWTHDGWWYIRELPLPTSGLGWVQSSPALSCADLKATFPATPDGQYWIDPNGGSNSDAFVAYCDMTTDGGGWTFVAHVDTVGVTPNFLALNSGVYRPDRIDDGTTYSVGASLLPYINHTEAMHLVGTSNPVIAEATKKLVVYRYTAGQAGFNSVFPCADLAPFSYRTTLSGPYTTGGVAPGTNCAAALWSPRAQGNWNALTGFSTTSGRGMYWGIAMGGTNLWTSDGWIYVR